MYATNGEARLCVAAAAAALWTTDSLQNTTRNYHNSRGSYKLAFWVFNFSFSVCRRYRDCLLGLFGFRKTRRRDESLIYRIQYAPINYWFPFRRRAVRVCLTNGFFSVSRSLPPSNSLDAKGYTYIQSRLVFIFITLGEISILYAPSTSIFHSTRVGKNFEQH